MHFAVPQGAAPASGAADRADATAPASSAAKQRASATTLILAMALVAIATKVHVIATPAPASGPTPAAQNSGTVPDKVIAPEFCKDQTWPYLDSRCLRRVDNPAQPAVEPRVVEPRAITPPANTTASAPVTNDATADNVAAPSASGETTAPPDQDQSASAAAVPNLAESQAAAGAQAGQQVMQSVFPAAAPGAASESGVQRADAAPYQRDVSQQHRYQHWNRHSGFFGFRF
jgi:hypothetical protein